MSNGLVWVVFKNGKRREISAKTAYDLQHQKTMGFVPEEQATQIPEEVKKKELHEVKSPVAEVETFEVNESADLDAPIEAVEIPAKPKRKYTRKQN